MHETKIVKFYNEYILIFIVTFFTYGYLSARKSLQRLLRRSPAKFSGNRSFVIIILVSEVSAPKPKRSQHLYGSVTMTVDSRN